MNKEPIDAEVVQFNAEPQQPSPVVKSLRKHDRFQDIHYDVIEGKLTAAQIAKKYNLRTRAGNYAVNSILIYRKHLDERHGELFAKAGEMLREILLNEYLDKHRQNYELAAADHEKAMSGKKRNFGAAKAMLDVMAQSASEIGKAVQIGVPQSAPSKVTNNKLVLMALPKAQPNSAPVRVIEASKSA